MKLAAVVIISVLVPAIAGAQNSGIFIQGGPAADVLFTGYADDFPVALRAGSPTGPGFTWNDLESSVAVGFPSPDIRRSRSRVVPGASAGIGVFITPSVSLRLEGSFQGERVATTETTSPLLSIVDRQALSVADALISAGWHQGGDRRTTITYLAGMVFRRRHEETSFTYGYSLQFLPTPAGQPVIGVPVPPPMTFENEFVTTSYGAGIMAGVDVTINLSRHLALVPQLRMIAANQALNVRPGVTLQWRP